MVFSQASGGNDILTGIYYIDIIIYSHADVYPSITLAAVAKEVLSKSNVGNENLAHIWYKTCLYLYETAE